MSEPVARTIKEFCRAYGISQRSAYNLMSDGTIVYKKMGTRTLIVEESARAWFDRLTGNGSVAASVEPTSQPTSLTMHRGAKGRKLVRVKGKESK